MDIYRENGKKSTMQKAYLILFLSLISVKVFAQIEKDVALLLTKARTQSDIGKVLNMIPYQSQLWWSIPTVPPINPNEFHNLVITSNFGMRFHPITNNWKEHLGIDIRLTQGTSICSPADGIVKERGFTKLLGNYVKIKHGFGFFTVMGHLDVITVKENQDVKVGEKVGECGNSGKSTGVHLHYTIIKDGKYLDPMNYVYYLVRKQKNN